MTHAINSLFEEASVLLRTGCARPELRFTPHPEDPAARGLASSSRAIRPVPAVLFLAERLLVSCFTERFFGEPGGAGLPFVAQGEGPPGRSLLWRAALAGRPQ